MRRFVDSKTAGISHIKARLVQITWMQLRCVVVFAICPLTAQANTHSDPGSSIGLVVWLLILGLAWGFLKSLFQNRNAKGTSQSSHGASRPVEPPTPKPEPFRTHYDNLQVARTATDTVIRAAYKGLAQKYHPDRFGGNPAEAERIMKLLNDSYTVLSDPIRRQEHDRWIDEQQGAKELSRSTNNAGRPNEEFQAARESAAAREVRERQLVTMTARYAPTYDQPLILSVLRNVLLYTGGLCGFLTIILGLQGLLGDNVAGAYAFFSLIACVVAFWGSSKVLPSHSIVTCPHCHKRSRVPSYMHMRFQCNTCKHEAEIQT